MNYKEVEFTIEENQELVSDILASLLGEIGFESFLSNNESFLAYCQTIFFDEKALCQVIEDFPIEAKISFSVRDVEQKNWNETWEKDFTFFEVNENCVVRHPQANLPRKYDYEIVVEPKMAFGSGYHETTRLVMNQMFQMNFCDANVLDMGCGTAVLAILASQLGAKNITAIDIDEFSYQNATHNCKLNTLSNVEVLLGDSSLLQNQLFDVILANINRNILLNDMERYVVVLAKNGKLLLSGFYSEDVEIICAKAQSLGLKKTTSRCDNNWALVSFEK